MKRAYWEKIAPSYNDEIFDVLHNDTKALIRSVIERYASKKKTVADIGCAIGKWLPVLSPAFKKVVAVDISAKNLEIAQQLYPQYKNVEYLRADMSGKKIKYLHVILVSASMLFSLHQKKTGIFFSGP